MIVPLSCFGNKVLMYQVNADISLIQNTLYLKYIISGNISSIKLTPTKQSKDLWKNTCFELFLSNKNITEYLEFNWAPSGKWNIFKFKDYRERANKDTYEKSDFIVKNDNDNIIFESEIILNKYNKNISLDINNLLIGISVIIETNTLEYWSNQHLHNKPDFHNKSSYLTLHHNSEIFLSDSI